MTADPFDTLGLQPAFTLTPAAINRAYLARAAVAHPDSAADLHPETDPASHLNAARAILADPERRAEALLARLRGPRPSDDKSLPPGFLMEMMERREEIESAAADPAAAEHWRTWALARRDQHIAAVAALFEHHRVAPDRALLTEIRRELNTWRYTERLIEQLSGREPGF